MPAELSANHFVEQVFLTERIKHQLDPSTLVSGHLLLNHTIIFSVINLIVQLDMKHMHLEPSGKVAQKGPHAGGVAQVVLTQGAAL